MVWPLACQKKLLELGLLDLAAQVGGRKKSKAKAAAPKPKPARAAAPAEPARGSSRLAAQPRVSYKPAKAELPSDDEGDDDNDDDSDDDSSADDASDDDGSELSSEDEAADGEGGRGGGGGGGSRRGGGGGGGGSSSLARGKGGKAKKGGKKAAKAKGGKKADGSATGLQTKNRVVSRGPKASVAPGGRGFKCPAVGCDTFFPTAEEAVEHGADECGVVCNGRGGRVYDEQGRTPCLWGEERASTMPAHAGARSAGLDARARALSVDRLPRSLACLRQASCRRACGSRMPLRLDPSLAFWPLTLLSVRALRPLQTAARGGRPTRLGRVA